MRIHRFISFLIASLSFLVACGGLAVPNMVPETDGLSTISYDRTLRVMPVTGAREEVFGGPARVSNEEYGAALLAALKNSGLFAKVTTEPGTDLELHATILDHDQGDSLNYRSVMVIEYRLTDATSGKDVWDTMINTRHEVKVSEALSGAKRTTKAQEGSVKKNLKRLVEELSEANL
jgi:hypothetical protein